jgi:hypothetical protein
MSIATVVTGGYGNGTLSGTIPFVVTRGYSISEAVLGLDDFEGRLTLQSKTGIVTLDSITGKIITVGSADITVN